MNLFHKSKRLKFQPYVVWGLLMLVYFAVGVQMSYVRGFYFAFLFSTMQFTVYQVNRRKLIPQLFEQNRQRFYGVNAVLVLSICLASLLIDQSVSALEPTAFSRSNPSLIFPFFLHSILCLVALWVSITEHLTEKEEQSKTKIEELIRDKAVSELKFLKMQINPHFLFNALNNIYTMSYIGDKSAHEKIARLSDMLRYVLYECESELIPLIKEIEYIESYIDFQQLKTEAPQNISFHYQVEQENCLVAPMLLIPFVENAFKHSKIEKFKNGFVNISLIQSREKLIFEVKNSFPIEENLVRSTIKSSGIGIKNVENRLELLYPGKHRLNIESSGNIYKVYMELDINGTSRKKI